MEDLFTVNDPTAPLVVEDLVKAWKELGEDTPVLLGVLAGMDNSSKEEE